MRKIALLSCDSLDGFVCYDDLLLEPFQEAGYMAEMVSWRADVDWGSYEAVIVRSTWDYQDDFESFQEVLKEIESSSASLFNSLEIMLWNLDKRYLKDLQEKGVNVIPCVFAESYSSAEAYKIFDDYDCDEIIIKPTVSANSDDTFRIRKEELSYKEDQLAVLFKNRFHMYQPFVPSVVKNGEYSLFYFSGEFSHAILKTPKSGDFRVQEEHGGLLESVVPCSRLKSSAEKLMDALFPKPLYARIDLVEYLGEFALMEVELIEPSLYFNLDSAAARRFVKAFENSKKVL